ncbi:hypothetical protein Syun_006112 [Stephania yunnanensis]|uniref:Uncharacterized protein n=1 Tax=Stephania yunnanensis TaxID=152371 RepID=A0AAP0KW20_9MAGN
MILKASSKAFIRGFARVGGMEMEAILTRDTNDKHDIIYPSGKALIPICCK